LVEIRIKVWIENRAGKQGVGGVPGRRRRQFS